MSKRQSTREQLVDALEAERLRPTPRPPRSGARLRCQWAPGCRGRHVAFANDPEGTGWLPVCPAHRVEAERDGVPVRDRP